MITTAVSSGSPADPNALTAQQWWSHAAPLSEHFFRAVGLFTQDTPREKLRTLFEMLQAVRRVYAALDYPLAACTAQAHLGAAMDQLLISFHYLLCDEIMSALDYLHSGQNSLGALALALDQIGVA